jgi:retinal rod rhodopsin-sensitive cGMP 3',5'-cyclic phosphodiesterase subunit delta
MNMSDADTGEILWEDNDWSDLLMERDIHIPARILKCRAVSREFQFSSVEMLEGLRLEQRIFFRGGLMEGPHPQPRGLV